MLVTFLKAGKFCMLDNKMRAKMIKKKKSAFFFFFLLSASVGLICVRNVGFIFFALEQLNFDAASLFDFPWF